MCRESPSLVQLLWSKHFKITRGKAAFDVTRKLAKTWHCRWFLYVSCPLSACRAYCKPSPNSIAPNCSENVQTYNISTAQGGGGSFQRWGTYRKGVCGVQLVRKSIDVRFKRVESQMIWSSSDLRFKWFWLSIDLRFNWFGCQLIWNWNDLVVYRCVLQMILVVCWFELQVMWLSFDLRFKWFGCQLIWDSSDLVVNRFEIQMSWLSIDLRFKWFGCQMIWGSGDLVVNWCVIMILSNETFVRDALQKRSFEAQKRSFSARLPSKMKLWRPKTKHFCETSFKIEALKLQNGAFLRDFLQNWSFEDQKRSISARLPSKMKLWSSKTNNFCETSFKNEAFKLKNAAFLRDFLQKWQVDQTLDLRIPLRFNDF